MIPYFYISQVSIGPITVHVWGLFVALGIICGTVFARHRAPSREVKQYIVVDLIFWTTLVSLFGAKIAFIFFNGKNEMMGFSSIGAILVGAVTVFVIAKIKKISIIRLLDVLGPPLLLAEGVGRIGCFLLHEHLGKITGSVLGLNVLGGSRHDLGLYFSLVGFAGVLLVLMFEKIWKKKIIGMVGIISIFWYFSWRFVLEFLLESSGPFSVSKIYGLTFMQIFSVVMMVVIALYFIYNIVTLRRNNRRGDS